MSGLLLIRDPCLLTAIHGADDGAIDDAHDATAFIGTVAAPSSRCRKQPSTRPSCRRTARQCCRAASAPRRCAPAVRVGLPRDTRAARTARGPQHRHGDGADREIGAGSYPQFVAMVSNATSAWGVALNTCQAHAHAAALVIREGTELRQVAVAVAVCVDRRTKRMPLHRAPGRAE
jgi:hypothetical protein